MKLSTHKMLIKTSHFKPSVGTSSLPGLAMHVREVISSNPHTNLTVTAAL